MSDTLGTIKGQMILDVKQALASYTAVRQQHVSTVTALSTGGAAIAASGAVIAGAGTAMAAGIMSAVTAAAEFERKLDFFTAVSGATADEYELIRQKALQLGADTIYSADQVADSFTELAKSGVSVQGLLGGIGEAVTYLGAATDMPLIEAASSLTSILNTFAIDAQDAVHVVDQLAGAANASSIDVNDLIVTMTYAGASAKTAGVEFSDVNAAIALLGERGIKGSKAGTGLRQMFDKLIAPTNKGKDALKSLGIILDDGTNKLHNMEGGLVPIPQLLDTLNTALDGMTAAEKMDVLGNIFPITSLPTILNLLDGGADAMARLTAEIGKTTAMDIADKRLDNLSGDIEILRGNIDTLAIESGSSLQGFARMVVQSVTSMVQAFIDLPDSVQMGILIFASITAAVLILVGTFGMLAGSILNIIGLAMKMAPAMSALVGILGKVTLAIKGLFLAMAANPVARVIALISLIATALVIFFTQTETGQRVWASLMSAFQAGVAAVMPLLSAFGNWLGKAIPAALAAVVPLLQTLGNFFQSILAPVLAFIAPLIQSVAGAFANFGSTVSSTSGIASIFTGLADAAASAIPQVLNFVGSLATQILTTLVTLAPQLIAASLNMWTGVINTVADLAPTMIPMIADVITKIITTLISLAPTLLIAAMNLLTGLITAFVEILPQIIIAVTTLITQIVATLITMLPTLIQGAVTLLLGLVQALVTILPIVLEGVITLVMGIVDALITMMPVLLQAAITVFMALVAALPVIISALVDMIPVLIEAAIQLFMAIVDALPQIIPPLIEAVINLIPTIISTLVSLIPQLLQAAIQLFLAIVTAIPKIVSQLIPALIKLIPVIINALISAIPQIIDAAIKLFMGIVQAIPQIVGELVNAVINLGTQIIQGLIKGISNMAGAVIKAIGGVVTGAIDWAKGLLGIKSPSRVFAEIGMFTMMGLVKGINSQQRALDRQMTQVVDSMTDFYSQVGAAQELDTQINLARNSASTIGVSDSTAAQLALLTDQMEAIANKDTFNVEKLEINNPEAEPASDSLPTAIRKTAHVIG